MPNNKVLLLRHCVRSTHSTIPVCDEDGNKTKVNATDFLTTPLPDYGVPEMWCLPQGLDIIQTLGNYLVNDILLESDTSKIVFHFVSDTSHRDVDTALALSKGMKAAMMNSTVLFQGLDNIQLSQDIFKPEGTNNTEEKIEGTAPICPRTEYLIDDLAQQVHENIDRRLNSTELEQAIETIRKVGATDQEWNFGVYEGQCDSGVGLKLDLVILVTEMLLYSRVGGVTFLPEATDEDIYSILQMADIIRSLERLGNVMAMKNGLVLAKSILSALHHNDDDNLHVTIFVGHDSNLDHVATALKLAWDLPFPYFREKSSGNIGSYVATPPGSGLLFSNTDSSVGVDFLFPIFDGVNNTKHDITPIYPKDWADNQTVVSPIANLGGLQQRITEQLHAYPELQRCYEKAPVYPEMIIERLTLLDRRLLIVSMGWIFVVTLIVLATLMRVQRNKKTKSYETVELQSPNSEIT